MSARVKFMLTVAGLASYVVLATVLVAAGIWASVGDSESEVLMRVLRSQAAFLVVAAALLVAGLAVMVGWFFTSYVLALPRLAAETRLVATSNPRHRLPVTGPAELDGLAAAVNELADRLQATEEAVAARVAAAQEDLTEERNRLATLMAELTLPVVVCNVEGVILLYNEAASTLLGGTAEGGGAGTTGYVGLGRSVFGVVDRSLIVHALDRIHAGATRAPAATTTSGGRLLRVRVAPVRGPGGDLTGFVLTLEDLTRTASAGHRRDALVRTLTEGTRGSLASIRAAVETLVDYPDMDVDRQRQFARAIAGEAEQLSRRIEQAAAEMSAVMGDPSLLEDVLAGDLLAALDARLQDDPPVPCEVEEPPGDLWLTVDGYGVVSAVADLVRQLREQRHAASVRLAVPPDAPPGHGFAALDVRWHGTPIAPADLTAWTQRPDVQSLLERHAAEAWCGQDEQGAFVRLLLPRATVPPPAPVHRPARPAPEARELYDFDLFRFVEGGSEWDDRLLSDLAYTVFDTETTGLHPREGDEIISIGAVRVVNRRLLRAETFEQLVDPRRDIPAASYAIHGISARMVRGQPVIEDVLPVFAQFAEGTVLVGHEVGFDLQFLRLKEQRAGVRFEQPALDTMLLSALVHAEHTGHSLEAVAGRLGVNVIGRHTALGDAIVTGEILVRLLDLLEQRGLRTLGEVREAVRRTALARRSEAIYPRD